MAAALLAEDPLPEEVRWRLDPRTVLRLSLDLADGTETPVRYNLDELASRGFLARGTRSPIIRVKNVSHV